MKRRATIGVLIVFGAFVLTFVMDKAISLRLPRPAGSEIRDVIFVNANLVDIANNKIKRNVALVIHEGEIVTVGSSANVESKIETSVKRIDVEGNYLIPGLWDMHVHVADPIERYFDIPMMFVNGILHVRDMWGDCVGKRCVSWSSILEMREMQKSIERGRWLGPRIEEIAGYAVDGPRAGYARRGRPKTPSYLVPKSPAEGRQLVRYFKQRGVDFIKTYDSLPRDVYFAMIDEARRIGIDVAGHVPKSVSLREAIDAGQRSVEHARMLPMACSDVAEEYRRTYSQWASSDYPPSDDDPNVDDVNLADYYAKVVKAINYPKCDALLAHWASSNTYYVPTHLTRAAEVTVKTRPYLSDPRSRYIGADVVSGGWDWEASKYARLFSSDPKLEDAYREYYKIGLELTGRAERAGVKIMAGTDSGDTLIYPGFSLHDELENLVRAGLSPAEALRSATEVPSEYEHESAQYGSIEPGKVAEFVLLADNPLANISNTKKIVGIYYRSRLYRNADLEEISKSIREETHGRSYLISSTWILLKRRVGYLFQ